MKAKSLLLKSLATTAIAFSALTVQAQMPGFFQRLEIGYSLPIATAEYVSKDAIVEPTTGATYNKENKTTVNSKFGYGGFIGTYFPVKRLGQKSSFAIGTTFMYNAFLWDYKVPYFNGYEVDSNGQITGMKYIDDAFLFNGMSVQMALPISADFKFGCDAINNKDVRFCATLGAGAMPTMAATVDASNAGFGFGVAPFVKGEVGIMAGLCFKLRAMYSFGNLPFYTEGNSIYGDINNFKTTSSLTGKSQLTLSLVIMPFAWSWGETGWWNSY